MVALVLADTSPPPDGDTDVVSVRVTGGGGGTGMSAKLALSVYDPGAPVAEPMVGVHVALVPQPLVQPDGVAVHLVKE